jgi:hypothetical protein
MNKKELSKILKPLIKECVKEIIFEEGTLSTIISEVIQGTNSRKVVVSEGRRSTTNHSDLARQKQKKTQEQKRKMLDAIGRDAYNGVDLFEGTTPTTTPRGSTSSPAGSKALDGVSPSDPGVDISSFSASGIWKKLAGT